MTVVTGQWMYVYAGAIMSLDRKILNKIILVFVRISNIQKYVIGWLINEGRGYV